MKPTKPHSRTPAPPEHEVLGEADSRFARVFESLPNIAVQGYRPDGTIKYWNKASEAVYGYTATEAIGRNLVDLIIPPEMRDEVRAAIRHGAQTGQMPPAGELSLLCKDGTRVPVFSSHAVVAVPGREPELFCLDLDLRGRKRRDARLDRVTAALLDLTDDCARNTQMLTAVAGELLEADCALYNRLEGGLLCARGQWQAPPGFQAEEAPQGHLCFDVIRRADDEPLIVRNLPATPYAASDPNVAAFGLKTYLGHPVRFDGRNRGSLCVVYAHDHEPTEDDRRILRLLAAAIGQEEERTRALNALQIKERTIETSIAAIALADPFGRLTYVNRAFLTMWGYSEPGEALGRAATEFWTDPAQAERVVAAVADQGTWNGELMGKRRDGATFLVELSAAQVRDAAGRITGLLASFVDVTERRQVREQLRASEEWLAKVADTVPDGITQVDRNGRIVFANAAAEQILRLSRRDITQRTYNDPGWKITGLDGGPIPPEALPFARVMQSGEPVFNVEHAIEHVDGTRALLSINAAPMRNAAGALDGMVASITDITERKRIEAALRENEERLRLALAGSNQGMFDLNLQTGEATTTPEYATMLGYDPADFRATLARWNELIHPADRDHALATLQACVTGANSAYAMEYRLRTADGGWKWVLSAGRVVGLDPAGRPLRLLGVHTDITGRKRAEEAVQESRRLYEDLVANMPLGVYRVSAASDGGFSFDYVSDRYCEIVGLTRETILSDPQATVRVIHPEDRADFERRNRAALERGQLFVWEGRTVVQGQPRWLRVESVPSPTPAGGTVWTGIVADITDRKRAETALRESEFFLKRSQEVARIGSYEFDIVAGAWICSPVLDQMFGIDGHFAKTIDGWLGLVVAEDREEMQRHLLEHVLRDRNRFDHEYRIIRASDGQERWVHGLGELEFDATGNPVRMIGTIQDITGRKHAEIAARESEALYRTVFQTSPDGMTLLDLEGRILFVSPAALKIYGVAAPAGAIGHSVFEFMAPEDHARARSDLAVVLASGVGHMLQYTLVRGDGTRFSGEVNVALLRDAENQPKSVLAMTRDVTERKRMEAAVREGEARLQAIFRAAPTGIGVVVSRVLREVNQRVLDMTGYSREEIVGADSRLLYPTDEDYAYVGREKYRQISERGTGTVETRWQRKDGTVIDVLLSSTPLDPADLTKGVTFTATDITERKRAEQERLDLERRLLHAQKLESLGVMAGGIAHDFNNLLMAILGNLDLALMDLSAASPARPAIEQSMLAARRAADLTRQMLAYSGKGKFDVRDLDLSEVVEENAHLFRTCISKIVVLNLQIGRGLPPIKADPGQIQQIIMNLITNASEAIGERAGVITLGTGVQDCDAAYLARSRVEEVPPAGRFVFVEVADSGCGMDENTLQRLFDPFFTTKFTGRGLGMSAILGIVRAHRGAILVDSEVGKGTTVRVLFPAGAVKSAAPPAGATGEAPSGSGGVADRPGAILVIDDEDMVRNVCQHILRKHGWTVFAAADGPTAINLFRAHAAEIALVFVDLSMPLMDGVEVFQALKAIRPDLKAILTSGYSTGTGGNKRLDEEGFAGFVQKPYSAQSLREEIARVLGLPA